MPVLDPLHERQLIRRDNDPSDRRRHTIELTSSGRQMIEDLKTAGVTIEHDLLAALDRDERALLHQLLLKLFDAISEDPD